MDLDWLNDLAGRWLERRRQGRTPHAVLLAGPAGTGKRATAAWMARQHVMPQAATPVPEFPFDLPEHADVRWVAPADDRQTISIEQVRTLVADLGLTSYEGGGKAAVIEPANVMTTNAANSLLKTLEEPPGDALLVLVADRVGRLPATIFSRCERIGMAPPPEAVAMAWLDRYRPGARWAECLKISGNAPLAALRAADQLDTTASMARELGDVAAGRASAVDVAAAWAKLDPGFLLDWLAAQVQLAIIAASAGPGRAAGLAIERSVLERMDRRNLFWYLDTINRLRARPAGSFNVQLALDALLIDLAGGLHGHRRTESTDGIAWLRAAR